MATAPAAQAQDQTLQAAASDTDAARRTVYQADFFVQFSPNNALDIARRVPGFVLEQSNGDVRGFSGAAGNVVINGARPSSKSESLDAILARIPAKRVLRVELASGDAFGSDYAGKSQVLNVVMSQAGGIDGNAKASMARLHDGSVIAGLEASVLIRSGNSTYNISASGGRGGQVEVGYDDVRRFSDGVRLEFRDKVNDIDVYEPFVAASWSHEHGSDRAEHLNLRYAPSHLTLFQRNHVTPAAGAVRDDRLEQDYRTNGYELGGDISRPLAGGAIKLVALANRRARNNFDVNFNRVAGATIGGFEQRQIARYDEVLGRASWSHPKLLGFSAELGGEVAYNRLKNATELFLLGPGGQRTRIDLPISQAIVDELRTESYLNLGRALTGSLRLDTSLAFETSRLEVSGDTSARRSLSFLKPGLTLDWKGKHGLHVQASMRRQVAQLDFYDFISKAELNNDRVTGGNADLVPQRSWEARLTIDRPVLGRGIFKLELGHDWVSLLADRVLTVDGFDAPGNVGSGRRKFARLTFDAPLDKLGIRATRLKIEGGVQQTRVRDPLTGAMRDWSGFRPAWDWSMELRRDLKRWSYGFNFSREARSAFFRIDEIDIYSNNRPYGSAFVVLRPDLRTTLRLDLDNVIDTSGERNRLFFEPNRTVALPFATEFRHRNSHFAATFSINRTFGAGGAAPG